MMSPRGQLSNTNQAVEQAKRRTTTEHTPSIRIFNQEYGKSPVVIAAL
jgi:hypothetical protein